MAPRMRAAVVTVVLLLQRAASEPWDLLSHEGFNLCSIDGGNGMVYNGFPERGAVPGADNSDRGNRMGNAASPVGDFNGDGFDDILVGAHSVDREGLQNCGECYLIFGTATTPAQTSVADLDGTTGVIFQGSMVSMALGYSVAGVGDADGDGFDDILLGAYGANTESGEVYLVYGTNVSLASTPKIVVSELDESLLRSVTYRGQVSDDLGFLGRSVSRAGDFNNDGYDDFLMGAPGDGSHGIVHMVWGWPNAAHSTNFDMGDFQASHGVSFSCSDELESCGDSVSPAGDVNNDGFDDIIIASYASDMAIMVFGSASTAGNVTLDSTFVNGVNAVSFAGVNAPIGSFGRHIDAIGDFNGDGFGDVLFSADKATSSLAISTNDQDNGFKGGQAYLVYGAAKFNATFDLLALDGENGVTFNGFGRTVRLGSSVAGVADLNNDGFDDLLVSSVYHNYNKVLSHVGQTWVVMGRAEPFDSGAFDPYTEFGLDQSAAGNGWVINGNFTGDQSGSVVCSAGDFNGDGRTDLVIGAPYANVDNAGKIFVVFNTDFNTADYDAVCAPEIVTAAAAAVPAVSYMVTSAAIVSALAAMTFWRSRI